MLSSNTANIKSKESKKYQSICFMSIKMYFSKIKEHRLFIKNYLYKNNQNIEKIRMKKLLSQAIASEEFNLFFRLYFRLKYV